VSGTEALQMTMGWFSLNCQTISPSSAFEPDTVAEIAEIDFSMIQ
jgi:hypothetical protein